MKTITVEKPKDVHKHLKNLAGLLAERALEIKGEYTCVYGGEKVRIVVSQ